MDKCMNQPEKSVEPKTYTVAEIAVILNVSERTAYNFCNKTSDFEVRRVGRCIRIRKDSFDNWFGGVI